MISEKPKVTEQETPADEPWPDFADPKYGGDWNKFSDDWDARDKLERERQPKAWVRSVCSYFRDFLATDFKKSRAPKRVIRSRDGRGGLTGISLEKYPELYRDIWERLSQPLGPDLSFEIKVRRGKYKTRLSSNLVKVIEKHINTISADELRRVEDQAKGTARDYRENFSNDSERYSDEILNHIKTNLLRVVISPFIEQLDKFFGDNKNSYNLEEELGMRLIQQISEPILSAIKSVIADNDFGEIDELIGDACDLDSIRQKFLAYFQNFSTSDFYRDLSELRSTVGLNDNFQVYIYTCAVRFGENRYPLFYFPVEVSLSDSVFTIKADPHLFINKKAVDFASGEITRDVGHQVYFLVPERILYLSEGDSFLTSIQHTLDELVAGLSLNGSIDLATFGSQKVFRSRIDVDNSLHFAAFDQSDESLLNDYEELLTILESESGVAQDFNSLIRNFMFSNNESFDQVVNDKWNELNLSDRLVYESPVRLNEEQRKIIIGLNLKDCHFVAVEGPPGTGKSHTITACVFDAIRQNKNVLILSDKKEALDVAENKIRDTFRTVRLNKNIQDPILRLGKQGSTYTKILSPDTIAQLQKIHQIALKSSIDLNKKIDQEMESIKAKIKEIEVKTKEIDIQKIAKSQRDEGQLDRFFKDAENAFRDPLFIQGICAVKHIGDFIGTHDIRTLFGRWKKPITLDHLDGFLAIQRKINAGKERVTITEAMRFFKGFSADNLSRLGHLISEYQSCKYPIVGFLFTKNRVRKIDRMLGSEFQCVSALNAHTNLEMLEQAEDGFQTAISDLKLAGIKEGMDVSLALFQYLQNIEIAYEDINSIRGAVKDYRSLVENDDAGYLKELGINESNLEMFVSDSTYSDLTNLEKLAAHAEQIREIVAIFSGVPDIDYVEEQSHLGKLQAQRLANIVDGRVVEFATKKKNTAAQIKTIIRKKQKFPKELFENLKEAFPVIISSIRDYAEYVPLEKGIFDLVIIDEASQVSIAQALPAFIRAKKILVLGDRKQFSNVKTSNASKAMNRSYRNEMLGKFQNEEKPNLAMQNQIEVFDIKTSVLDFVERIANLKIMLQKHFRGYPDLIGFSSQYFYGYALQSVKIRGKRIEDVIEFVQVDDDNLNELNRNVNQPETEAIIIELERLSQLATPPDVCVITPHTEQQRHIYYEVLKREDSSLLMEKLKLRVFTFDTCQGEEAHTILYSMVATQTRDRLNYIFAKDIKGDDVEDLLRLQRLNVGFSRAKERVCFFHSKPIKDFSGSIHTALSHFQTAIKEAKKFPGVGNTDRKSPMETKVLHWLRQVPLLTELGENVEIEAQFKIGDYLQQIDSTYIHPKYKVDFLIKVRNEDKETLIVIEYDGFKEHFTDLSEVDASNYEFYMKPDDIERQKILEGYGYKFLRINRFNVGADPVRSLDERLRRIVGNVNVPPATPELITEDHDKLQSLEDGKSKICSRCKEVRKIEEFYDATLKNRYGRVCLRCKGHRPPKKTEKVAQVSLLKNHIAINPHHR